MMMNQLQLSKIQKYDAQYAALLRIINQNDCIFKKVPTRTAHVIHYKGHIFEKDGQRGSYKCRYTSTYYKRQEQKKNPNFKTCHARIKMDQDATYIIQEKMCEPLNHSHVNVTHPNVAENKYALREMKRMVIQTGNVDGTLTKFANDHPEFAQKVHYASKKRSLQQAKFSQWKLPKNPLDLKLVGTRWEYNIYHKENECGTNPNADKYCAKMYHQPYSNENIHIFATKYTAAAAADSQCVAFICDGTAKCTPKISTITLKSNAKEKKRIVAKCQQCNEVLQFETNYSALSISTMYAYGFECNNCGIESESKFSCYHCPKCSDQYDLCEDCADLQIEIRSQKRIKKSKCTNSLHKQNNKQQKKTKSKKVTNRPWKQIFEVAFGYKRGDDNNNNKMEIIVGYTALIDNFQEKTYIKIFQFIKKHITECGYDIDWNKLRFMCDYEVAIRNAIKNVFGIDVTGEQFHFTKSNIKRIQKYGLMFAYWHHANFRRHMRCLLCLSFLPEQKIKPTYEIIKKKLQQLCVQMKNEYIQHFKENCETAKQNNEKLPEDHTSYYIALQKNIESYFKYFERTWFKKYNISMWNVYGQLNRTTNNLEGWHTKFNDTIGGHLNIFEFLLKFQRIQNKDSLVKQQQISEFGNDGPGWNERMKKRERLVAKIFKYWKTQYQKNQVENDYWFDQLLKVMVPCLFMENARDVYTDMIDIK